MSSVAESPVAFSLPDITDDDRAAVMRVLHSGWLTTGEECLQLEAELAAYLDVPHVVTVSSCTAALEAGARSFALRLLLDPLRAVPVRLRLHSWAV